MDHIHLETVDSTRTYARAHVDEFNPNGITLITANEQTAGKGQYSRTWTSPPGKNLLATYAFQLPLGKEVIHLARLLALSASKVLETYGLSPKFKQPNDLLINNKKIAGTIGETTPHPTHTQIFASIGIDVNMSLEELSQIDQPATSIFVELGKEQDIAALQEKLSQQFLADLALPSH